MAAPALGLLVGLACLPASSRGESAPACRVSVEAEPSNPVVGEQVVYTARIVRRADVERVDWLQPLSFPGFRSERLRGHREDTPMRYRGVEFWAREDRRALFPTRAGRFEISGATLRCTTRARGPGASRVADVELPKLEIEVRDPPMRDRPADYAGAIGPISIRARVDRNELQLGESLRVSILVRSDHDLWAVASPAGTADWSDGLERFPQPSEVRVESGSRLHLRAFHRLDVVPRTLGRSAIPAFRIHYYDPSTGSYQTAESAPIELQVLPRATRARDGDASTRESTAKRARADEESGRLMVWIGVALGLPLLVAAALAFHRRHRRWRSVDAQLRAANEAGDDAGRVAALARALRIGLAATQSDCDASGVLDGPPRARLEADPEFAPVVALLDSLEARRFGDGGSSPSTERQRREELAAVCSALLRLGIRSQLRSEVVGPRR